MTEEKVINIEELTQDEHNFNKGTVGGAELMERSLKELGAGRSILIDKNGTIIAGNKTQEAAIKAGITKVRVIETDGTELVALMISRKSNVSTGTVILIFNLIIFTVASLLFGVDRALLSLLTYYIASRIIDKVEEGLDTAKQVIVITDDAEPIADAIYKRLGRTVTISSARGLVSGKKEMLYVVITRLELPELREIVEESDESAFITISDVNEIIGKHVQKVDKAVVEELEA